MLLRIATEEGTVGSQLQQEGQHVVKKDHDGHSQRIEREAVPLVVAFEGCGPCSEADDRGNRQQQQTEHQLAGLKLCAAGLDGHVLFPLSCQHGADAQHQQTVGDHGASDGDHHQLVEATGEGRDAHHQLHKIAESHAHDTAVAIAEVITEVIHQL